jgi:hypothetical protein
VYLYGNLLVKKAPATLYYYFIPDVKDKQYAMNPISTTDPNFTIASVTYNGADYPLVDKKNRIITVPANSGGKFAVTYSMTGATNVASPALTVPGGYTLKQNYPNPFNPSTQITFTLPAQTSVTLGVYDMLGREVAQLANGTLAAGEHSVTWNASGIPSGVYVYRIRAGVFTETKKLILQR